jgi:hypothetical protein
MSPARLVTSCIIVSAVWALLPAPVLAASCTEADRRDMRREGLSPRSIERICTSSAEDDDHSRQVARAPSARPAQRMSNRCMTPVVACVMGASGPVGTPCWCATPFGPASGLVQ